MIIDKLHKKIKRFGIKGETFNDIVQRMADVYERHLEKERHMKK